MRGSGLAGAPYARLVLRVGLTGGIGAGKSTVARLLAERGAVVVDADVIAREAVAAGTPGLAAVLAEFGDAVRAVDGTLDRAALARLVFTDPQRLAALNAIVHPLVAARTTALVAAAPPDAVVVHDVPLLVENALADRYDVVVVVDAPDEVRTARLRADRGMAAEEVARRMAAQVDREVRLAAADVVIDNGGGPASTRAQVDVLWPDLLRRAVGPGG